MKLSWVTAVCLVLVAFVGNTLSQPPTHPPAQQDRVFSQTLSDRWDHSTFSSPIGTEPMALAQRYYRRPSNYQQRYPSHSGSHSASQHASRSHSSRTQPQATVNPNPQVGPGLPEEPQILPGYQDTSPKELTSQNQLSVEEVEQQFKDLSPLDETSQNLKTTIEQLLAVNAQRPFTTKNNSIEDMINFCFPFGAETLVYHTLEGNQGGYLYAIGCLCWNYPFEGKRLFRSDGTFPITKMGFGYQKYPSTFLAMLAFSKIDESYEIRLGDSTGLTLADLVESEKHLCSRGDDLSLKLVGLSFYVSPEEKWENLLDEEWSLERIVFEELERPVDQSCEEITNQLLGFSAAIKRFQQEGKNLSGPLAEAEERVSQYQDFALEIRNTQGGWHPKFFLYRGTGSEFYSQLFANAHILRWLIDSLPENRLRENTLIQSVHHLAEQVNRVPRQVSPGSMSAQQIEGLSVALHALALYHDRVFAPHQRYEKAKAAAEANETSQSNSTETQNDGSKETPQLTPPQETSPSEPSPLEDPATENHDSETKEEDSSELPQP